MEGIEVDRDLVEFACTANRVTVDHLQTEVAKLQRCLDVANAEIAVLQQERAVRKRLRSSQADDHEIERRIWADQHADDTRWVNEKTVEWCNKEAKYKREIAALQSELKLQRVSRKRWAGKLREIALHMEEK